MFYCAWSQERLACQCAEGGWYDVTILKEQIGADKGKVGPVPQIVTPVGLVLHVM